MKRVNELNVNGKTVLVRCDFNVPLKDGAIRDDNRIRAALPTIQELINKGAKVVLMSHLGKVDHKDPVKCEENKKKNNLAPVAVRLGELLGKNVTFCPATRGDELLNAVKALNSEEISLHFTGDMKPIILKSKTNSNLIQLILPVRTYN